jgi:hypothetical protein
VIEVQRSLKFDRVQIWTAGIFAVGCIACTSAKEGAGDRVLARAYDQVLRWSELRQVIPLESTPEDSTALAERFIDGWLRQQVVLHVSELNQPPVGSDMEAQIEDYRRSLVIFNYEQALVQQKLDTAVSAQEIAAYYDANQANFELKDNILRVRWFKVNEAEKRVLRKMEERFLRGDLDERRDVEIWLAQRGVSIIDRTESWISEMELRTAMALPAEETGPLSKVGKRVVKEGTAAWFIEVVGSKDSTSPAPVELVEQDIRSILLNQRKLQLIAAMREDVYKDAIDNEDVERFDP